MEEYLTQTQLVINAFMNIGMSSAPVRRRKRRERRVKERNIIIITMESSKKNF
jgi:hypothetical protein